MNQRIHFEGSFIEYFLIAVGLVVVCFLTLGLALPYYFYWSLKYFFTKLRIGDQKIAFTGNFGEYFLTALGLLVVSVITLGLALPYYGYWTFKYFFAHLELQGDVNSPTRPGRTALTQPERLAPPVLPPAPLDEAQPVVTAQVPEQPTSTLEPVLDTAPAPEPPPEPSTPQRYRFGG